MEQKDQLLHITLMDGMVRGLLLTATHTVAEAAAIHLTSPVATAALGRTLMGTAMMGAMLKADQASVTVTLTAEAAGPHRLRRGSRQRARLRGCAGPGNAAQTQWETGCGTRRGMRGAHERSARHGHEKPLCRAGTPGIRRDCRRFCQLLCRQRADAHAPEPGRAGQRRGGAVGGRGAAAAPAGLHGRYYQPARAAQPNDG